MPKYHCYLSGEDYDSSYRRHREFEATCPGKAAEAFRSVEDRLTVEYPVEYDVVVRDCATCEEIVFTVTLRAEPVYTAKRKKVSG